MQKIILALVAMLVFSQETALSQSGPPTKAIDITEKQVQAVLNTGKGDQTLRVLDMGNYQLSLAIVHRGKTAARTEVAVPANAEKCGLKEAPAGAPISPPGMIAHADTVETYIVVSGEGTLITGGQIVDGHKSAPDSDVTRILNGPSCSGRSAGNIVSRHMGVGDMSVIPEGVPHGWTDIADHVDYISVRPDMKKVLQHGYVNPHLMDNK
jgi:mannose-6-phosphate isomerase-like protein (cupin superfamily)